MSTRKSIWRVGQRTGQTRWQIKRAPGWSVVHQCDSLHEAAEWLVRAGVDLSLVQVLVAGPWRPLSDYVAANV